MGGRLSVPKGPAATTEASVPVNPGPPPSPKRPFPRTINSRTIVAPAAAATMAILLFVYTRTSIRAAKANAQRHRQADSGGEGLSLLNESRRRHGLREQVGSGGTVRELAAEGKKQILGDNNKDRKSKTATTATASEDAGRSLEEERLRALKDAMGRRSTGK